MSLPMPTRYFRTNRPVKKRVRKDGDSQSSVFPYQAYGYGGLVCGMLGARVGCQCHCRRRRAQEEGQEQPYYYYN